MAVVRVSTTNDFLMKTGFICFSCSNSHHQHIRQLHSMHYSGSGEIVTRSFAVGQVVVYTRTNVCRMAGGVVHRSRRARRGPWQCRSIRRLSIEDKSGLGEGRVRSEGGRNHRPRPNLEAGEARMHFLCLGFGRLSGSCESAASEAAGNVLLLLLGRFENLE
jgi:hypothetical protein